MSKKSSRINFAVGSSTGSRSTVWRMWTQKHEIYLSSVATGDAMKVSCHESTTNISVTYEFLKALDHEVPLPNSDRHFVKAQRAELAPGIYRLLSIVFPPGSLIDTTEEYPKADTVIWIGRTPIGQSVEVTLILLAKDTPCDGWPGKNNGTQLLGERPLNDGQSAWLVWRMIPTPEVLGIPASISEDSATYIKGDRSMIGNHALLMGTNDDGSLALIEASVEYKRMK